ncbi:MAG: sn-glycerol-1-phosphate dehydrogenase [Caldilineaceae bacterium]
MSKIRPQLVTIDQDAINHLLTFCKENQLHDLLVVSDRNTRRVLGQRVEEALKGADFDVKSAFFDEDEPVADGEHVMHVLLACDRKPRTFIAIGGGTITDITRVVSHRTRCEFISMPTAPSVDAYASIGAPLIINGVKISIWAHAPIAIIADIDVLCNSPRAMIAAGFGDMIAKFTSVADFRLGALVWNEPFDPEIADRMAQTAIISAQNAEKIGSGSAEGVKALLEQLIESGYIMLDFGNSRPASGTEHHYSHLWEMKLLQEGRHGILHGAKTGFATTLGAQMYETVRNMSRSEASDRLEASNLPNRDAEIAKIRTVYGQLADEVIATHKGFINMTEAQYDQLKQNILDHWDEVQAVAATVPSPAELVQMLKAVGGPTSITELGLTEEDYQLADDNAHYLRERFTVRKLMRVLGEKS